MLVRTRIASNKSPWLARTKPGEIYTVPVSHGEGRFFASEELIRKLAENGQIAAQYVDMFFVNVGWVLFNLVDVAELEKALRIMFVWQKTDWAGVFASNTALMTELLYLPIAVVCCLPVKKKLRPIDGLPGAIIENVWYVGLLALCIMFILSSSYNPFIYFRF